MFTWFCLPVDQSPDFLLKSPDFFTSVSRFIVFWGWEDLRGLLLANIFKTPGERKTKISSFAFNEKQVAEYLTQWEAFTSAKHARSLPGKNYRKLFESCVVHSMASDRGQNRNLHFASSCSSFRRNFVVVFFISLLWRSLPFKTLWRLLRRPNTFCTSKCSYYGVVQARKWSQDPKW